MVRNASGTAGARSIAAFLLLAAALALGACGPSLEEIDARIAAAAPTPAATATPQPAPTPPPTATPQPTPSPAPAPTPQPTATPQPLPTPVLPANLQSLREFVVRVNQDESTGSGVVFQSGYSPDGRGHEAFVLTNAHVIDGDAPISVAVWDESDWGFFTVPGAVVGADADIDLAVVHVCCDARLSGREAKFGRDMDVYIGRHVSILGYPYGRNIYASATAGIISARAILSNPPVQIYLTDAPANPGNSGGPLLLSNGAVIGIVTAKTVGLEIEGQAQAISIATFGPKAAELCAGRCRIPEA